MNAIEPLKLGPFEHNYAGYKAYLKKLFEGVSMNNGLYDFAMKIQNRTDITDLGEVFAWLSSPHEEQQQIMKEITIDDPILSALKNIFCK